MGSGCSIAVLGLTLSSSWGNGHATTWRALIRGLAAQGHRVVFLERDMPWYAANRDLPDPEYCRLETYSDLTDLERFAPMLRGADLVIVGSYVPDGAAVIERVARLARGALAFYDIDTPITMARLEAGEEDYLARAQVPLFDLYLSFSGGPVLDRLEARFGARRAVPFYCSVDADQYSPTGEPPAWDLGYLGTYSPDRQPALERLLIEPARRLPDLRFAVAGPQYPSDIAWPDNVERIEHLPPAEHPSFYSRQRFTLNVTRADMVRAGWSPSVRLFEAAACGTPILSDRWPGLDALLPEGEAILTVDRSEQVVATLTSLSEARRQALARSARARVLASHTGAARAQELIDYLHAAAHAEERPRQAGAST